MKRPLFWIGLVFLSSTAVFLRFVPPVSIVLSLAVAIASSFLAANRFSLRCTAVLTAASVIALFYNFAFAASHPKSLSAVTDTSAEHAVIHATVTESSNRSGYQLISARCDIAVGENSKTADAKLVGYFKSAPMAGDTVACLADYDNGVYRIKSFINHDGTVRHPLLSLRLSVQNAVSQKILSLFDQPFSGFLAAVIAGSSTHLNSEIVSNFRASSLSHLLVVSGMHLAIISNTVSSLVSKFLSKRTSAAVSMLFCWSFAALSGFGVSIVRAALMLTIMNIAKLIGRKGDVLTSLMTAALIIVIPSPQTVLSASFLLSFTAVAGLALLQKPIFQFIGGETDNKLATLLRENAASAAAAQLATAPICAIMFNSVPLMGVLANLAAVWLLQPIMALGILSLIFGFISPILAAPFMLLCKALISLIAGIAAFFGSLPFSILNFTERWQFIWLLGAAILTVILLCRIHSASAAKLAAIGLAFIYIAASVFYLVSSRSTADIILFENSDCAAIVKSGHAVLIGSPDDTDERIEIDSAFTTLGVEKLHVIVAFDSSGLEYSTAKLAKDYNCSYLSAPNDKTSQAFCHSSGLTLCRLPSNSLLLGGIVSASANEGCEIVYKNVKLLKIDDNYDIIGRYSSPMPLKGIERYRVNTIDGK